MLCEFRGNILKFVITYKGANEDGYPLIKAKMFKGYTHLKIIGGGL